MKEEKVGGDAVENAMGSMEKMPKDTDMTKMPKDSGVSTNTVGVNGVKNR